MKVHLYILILILNLLSVGCASNAGQDKPAWVDNPELGVSASCETHIKGRHYQEQLAIARARQQLAARYGVEVSSEHKIKQEVTNDSSYVTSIKEMQQVVNGKTVKARVRKKWHDTRSDVLWIWLYPTN